MENLVEIKYAQTGKSSSTDELGMREMQAVLYIVNGKPVAYDKSLQQLIDLQ